MSIHYVNETYIFQVLTQMAVLVLKVWQLYVGSEPSKG